uniref:BPTI/Kunitz inhibitor domain-containing protein n=1 Tax=Timema shepardi TaxID=629360 RepID=A0A7R9B774_TIMSH|nr:unnamed protein product [Timema shepardi]
MVSGAYSDEADYEESEECCALPPVSGKCLAYMPRYYFDPETKSCTRFVYGGCLGNCNKFISEDKCLEACNK